MTNTNIWQLEKYVDIKGLEKLHLDICYGIAKSQRDLSTRPIPHYEQQGKITEAINFKNSELSRISNISNNNRDILTDTELALYDKLNYNQKRFFLELYKKAYTDGEFVRIRHTKQQYLEEKFSTFYSQTTDWTENAPYFTSLIDWIQKLPFIDIGRILIFITKHYLHGDLHYDRRDEWLDGRHHFIWLNPFQQKKFYIFDGHFQKQITNKAIFFDTSCIHGSGQHNHTVYSIRIDGQLDQKFCNMVDIKWTQR